MFAVPSRKGGADIPAENMTEAFGPAFVPQGKKLIWVLSMVCDRWRRGEIEPEFPIGLDLDLTNDVATIVCGLRASQAELIFAGRSTAARNIHRIVSHTDGSIFRWIAEVTGPVEV